MKSASMQQLWHPYTQMLHADELPQIVKASGSLLFAANGQTYIDAISSWWVLLHGHSHPAIVTAIQQQAKNLQQVIFSNFTHQTAIDLAAALVEVSGNHWPHVFLSDNGSTAVEAAIKMTLQYWQQARSEARSTFITLENSYHGDTFGAMSVSSRSVFNQPFRSLTFEVLELPAPDPEHLEACLIALQAALTKGNIAGFIYEPLVQGAGGMRMYNAAALEQILRICKKHSVICIADEVMTGFGRTGTLFASEQCQTKPDIICLSKALTGGTLPLGATLANSEIYQAFLSEKRTEMLLHGHSFTANALACAAALASIKLCQTPEFERDLKRVIQKLGELAENLQNCPFYSNVRQTGLILAFEFETSETGGYSNKIFYELKKLFFEKGINLRPLGDTIYLLPPICCSDAELDYIAMVLENLGKTGLKH